MGGENRARGSLSDLGAAFRLSRRRDDGALFVLADQALRDKVFRDVRDSGNVLPVILPSATRSRAVTGDELVDTASVSIDNSALRGIRTKVRRVGNSIFVRIGRE